MENSALPNRAAVDSIEKQAPAFYSRCLPKCLPRTRIKQLPGKVRPRGPADTHRRPEDSTCLAKVTQLDEPLAPPWQVLVLATFCPWKSHLLELEEEAGIAEQLKYVVYPEGDPSGKWRIQVKNRRRPSVDLGFSPCVI